MQLRGTTIPPRIPTQPRNLKSNSNVFHLSSDSYTMFNQLSKIIQLSLSLSLLSLVPKKFQTRSSSTHAPQKKPLKTTTRWEHGTQHTERERESSQRNDDYRSTVDAFTYSRAKFAQDTPSGASSRLSLSRSPFPSPSLERVPTSAFERGRRRRRRKREEE